MPRRLRAWYVVGAALLSAIIAAVPACPVQDAAGRPLWRVDVVHDGDTVTCLDTTGKPQKIRLRGIDAPEFDQPHGREARQALALKLTGGSVRVEGAARDQHGRLLGTLWLDDRDLNRELVAEGHAWVFGGFAPDPDLLAAEAEARQARRGLWAAPHPLAPQQWRAEHPSHR
jgi:endonuclease YncB( thermonuclease family)